MASSGGADVASQAEIRQTVTDVRCKASTALIQEYRRVQADVEERLANEHAGLVAEFAAFRAVEPDE